MSIPETPSIPPPEPPSWRKLHPIFERSYRFHRYKRYRKLAALRPTHHNEVIIYDDGDRAYDEILKAIEGAEKNINISTYILESDYVGRIFKEKLIKKVVEGVEVNIIYDAVGSMRASRKFFREMKNAGIHLVVFRPLLSLNLIKLNRRLHRKLFVIDGKIGFIGGMNISCEYAGPKFHGYNWRDLMARVDGPAVGDLQAMFMVMWHRVRGPLPQKEFEYFPQLGPAGNKDAVVIGTDFWKERKQLREVFLILIRKAEKEICIESAYFLPDIEIRRELRKASLKGIKVKIIIPRNTDIKTVYFARRTMYSKFLKAGIEIYEYTPRILHTKMAVFDRTTVVIGSANFDYRSFLHNIEGNIFVEGGEIGEEAYKIFEKDLSDSEKVDYEEFIKRPLIVKIMEWFLFIFRYLL